MKLYSLMPHFMLVLPFSPTSTVTMPSGRTRIISPRSFAVMTTASPLCSTSASMF